MNKSIGLIEVIGLSTGILVADTMVKAASVNINDIEITKGMGFVTVKIVGNVAAVTAAVNAGKNLAMSFDKYISSKIIPRPLDSTFKKFFENNQEEKDNKKVEETKKSEPKPAAKKQRTSSSARNNTKTTTKKESSNNKSTQKDDKTIIKDDNESKIKEQKETEEKVVKPEVKQTNEEISKSK